MPAVFRYCQVVGMPAPNSKAAHKLEMTVYGQDIIHAMQIYS